MQSLKENRGARYLAASIVALAVDYALTLVLYHAGGIDLSIAAAIAFIIVGATFYLVHEFWTFRDEAARFSGKRMAGNLLVMCVAGLVRVGLIAALELFRSPAGIWVSIYFTVGVAGSFTTNYLLNRYVVFRR
ncbi:MAG: GtrA family protein [Hyphomonas sp.]|uniref:GtrA family protein n=1 Tax=Hyphomonas sp. TaxID=87 RepID=UPI003527C884